MPGSPHYTAAGEFDKFLAIKFFEIGVFNKINLQASALRRMGNVSKEPDGSVVPLDKGYATFVLEVGMS
jgi:hypothetical protein